MKCPNCRAEMKRSPGMDTERRLEDGRIRRLLCHLCLKCSNVVTVEHYESADRSKPYKPTMELK